MKEAEQHYKDKKKAKKEGKDWVKIDYVLFTD